MKHVLLLGAGFSNNWGGPLASDVFDWLLQRPEISGDGYLKQMLWNTRINRWIIYLLVGRDCSLRVGAVFRSSLDAWQAAACRTAPVVDRAEPLDDCVRPRHAQGTARERHRNDDW
jgi:hypothetical protein